MCRSSECDLYCVSTAIQGFLEKPADPPGLADSPDEVYASMGNYVFDTETLVEVLDADAQKPGSKHDMGGDIIPALVAKGQAAVYDFRDNVVPGSTDRDRDYWRDVGTIDSYHEAHLDLVSAVPQFNLYNQKWPIFSDPGQLPGAKFVHGASVRDSIVCAGSIVSGASIESTVIGKDTFVADGAMIQRSVIMDSVRIGEGAVIRNAIIDKHVVVPSRAVIGVDHDEDRRRGFSVSEGGVVTIGKGRRWE